jgi:hypothetical protein
MFWRFGVGFLLSTLLLISTISCGGGSGNSSGDNGSGSGGAPSGGQATVSIAIAPTSATLSAGGMQQFQATVTGATNTAVQWQVNGVSGGTSATGTISTSGLYTAPATTVTIQVMVTAVSNADTTKTASAAVTVNPSPMVTVTISPTTATLAVDGTQQFTATVTGENNNGVTWSVDGVNGGNGTVGTVSSSGLYTAPSTTGTYTVTATSVADRSKSASATVTVVALAITSISVTPNPASFPANGGQQFTAMAMYNNGTNGNITSTATWTSSNPSAATIDSSGLASGVAPGTTTITAAVGTVNGSASATVTIATTSAVNIPTWHVDTNRSGLNANETLLTPSNVVTGTFGKLFSYLVDGYVYGEPLIISNVMINGVSHNVLYVATEYDSVYAFDADDGDQTPLWQTSLLQPGEQPLSNGPIQPWQGVTSTPVIDTSTNTIYVVSTEIAGGGSGTFRLNALDITTGAQKFGGPVTITASVQGTNNGGNGNYVTLSTACLQRSALLEANGNIYFGFGSCRTGWLLAYNATTLAQVGVFNASPYLAGEGQYASAGGIWMGGGGPVADSSGNVYVTTGNGPWDGMTAWGDSVLRFPQTPVQGLNGTMQPVDYFTPDAYAYMNCADADLASGGLLLIPGTTTLVSGGKLGMMYLNNSGNLGHESNNNTGAESTNWFEPDLSPPYQASCTDSSGTHTTEINSYEIFGTSAYFNGNVYLGISPTNTTTVAPVRQFPWSPSGLDLSLGAYTSPSILINTRGTTPFLSANGTTNGILWMIDEGTPLQEGNSTNATLRAYDIENFPNQIYNSSQNPNDVPGYGIKFTSPVVVNGKAYISTGHNLTTYPNPQGEIDVYGLLPQ